MSIKKALNKCAFIMVWGTELEYWDRFAVYFQNWRKKVWISFSTQSKNREKPRKAEETVA
ncbi:MAG: hypothetical protein CVU50_07410 [Candidatus Cloacimonetes bacterium HGW-Cloacimonetes-3]|jgi:hypothetical protein|nr:MAG: hypothetical protein CVU50_07410 [Candidatus Cloacimonetes bacterium HGW-Cloacimonetes-3]